MWRRIWSRRAREAHDFALETERLILRLPQRRDYLPWVALRRRNAVQLQSVEPQWRRDHLSARRFHWRVAIAERAFTDRLGLDLMITLKPTDASTHQLTIIGGIRLECDRQMARAHGALGYWLDAAWQGQGLMGEAVTAVVGHSFNQLEISRIEALCLPENSASWHVLERAGFALEGRARAALQINSHWRDHLRYVRLKEGREEAAYVENGGL